MFVVIVLKFSNTQILPHTMFLQKVFPLNLEKLQRLEVEWDFLAHSVLFSRAYSKRVHRTNCALRIKKCAPRISSGIYFLSTS